MCPVRSVTYVSGRAIIISEVAKLYGGSLDFRFDHAPRVHADSSVILQQTRDGRAMDQGQQGGGEDDAAELLPVPGQRGTTVAERYRLQRGKLMAPARVAEADRHVVADELAATVDEDGWPSREVRAVLLADAGGRTRHAVAVRGDRTAA